MTPTFSIQTQRTARMVAHLFACLALTTVSGLVAADPDQSRLAPPPGDGWQLLSAPVAKAPVVQIAMVTPAAHVAAAAPILTAAPAAPAAPAARKPAIGGAAPSALPGAAAPSPVGSLDVAPVVVPSQGGATAAGGILSFTITPQDINLRNALDRWLQQQGWQLAWKIDDDLPLEFNATFSGDFKSVLTQVMQATNHMRTPTRVCKHTNNVIRVVARAANCQE
ncbi:toxin co-regulated pilus biosynthesis Q family protein [Caballeronia sp. LZ001]|uniref:toxin co-regulated pilus biosynthesis Q family protein n=1 Tax=Caballeronia sp. LZ001 TaxID=3038553 RepID=UPI002855415B|nr:toxin co-regulated pilus biosynthesis Q family protein [Caballeronia sp. LZ001]MDR5806316.1 toxin co-regulated pilus biosynthesis Q family protein [Caballeronia sp. LZ001]